VQQRIDEGTRVVCDTLYYTSRKPLPDIRARVTPSNSSSGSATAAPVDDEHATIARGLSDNERSVLRFLLDHNAVDCPRRYPQADIAEELGMSKWKIQWCRKTIGNLAHKLIESKDGRGGGVWLSPVGAKVASRIQPQTCLQFRPTLKVKTFSTGSH
jgi:hypothetical protein